MRNTMVNKVTLQDLNVSFSTEIKTEAQDFLRKAMVKNTINSTLFAEHYYIVCDKPWSSDLSQYVIKEKPKGIIESILRFLGFGHRTSNDIVQALKILSPSDILKKCLNKSHVKDRHWWNDRKISWVTHQEKSYSHHIPQNKTVAAEQPQQKEPLHYHEIAQPKKTKKAPPVPVREKDRLRFAKHVMEQLTENVEQLKKTFPNDPELSSYINTLQNLKSSLDVITHHPRKDLTPEKLLTILFDFKQPIDSALTQGVNFFDDPFVGKSFQLPKIGDKFIDAIK